MTVFLSYTVSFIGFMKSNSVLTTFSSLFVGNGLPVIYKIRPGASSRRPRVFLRWADSFVLLCPGRRSCNPPLSLIFRRMHFIQFAFQGTPSIARSRYSVRIETIVLNSPGVGPYNRPGSCIPPKRRAYCSLVKLSGAFPCTS